MAENYYKKQQDNGEEKNYSLTMTQVLANKNIVSLAETLHLTEEQKAKAASSALELSSNAALYKCDKFSLAKFCFETARYNFSRPDCIYPVPYDKYVQAQLGYRGYKELAMRSGLYKEIDSVEVLECDKLHRDRATGRISVEFEEDVNKTLDAKVVGFYAYAITKDGEFAGSVYWTNEKCIAHGKQYSKSYNSIWGNTSTFSKMALKTVLKQLLSKLPTTPEIQAAIKQDQIVYGGEGEEDKYRDNPYNDAPEYTDVEIENETLDTLEDNKKKQEELTPQEFLDSIGYGK